MCLTDNSICVSDTSYALETAGEAEDLQVLTSGLFHDLDEPLRTIRCSAAMMRAHSENDIALESWRSYIEDNVERIRDLVDDFRALAGAITRPATAKTEMNEVLETSKRALAASIRDADATITSDELPCVEGNAVALSRVFQNLLSNAIKYRGKDAPVIRVGCRGSGRYWIFSVTDNGIGIDHKYHGGLFAPFKRLHSRQAYPGSGLGLAICRRIVTNHGGSIWLQSDPGLGSTFYFALPRAPVQESPKIAAAECEARSATPGW